MENFTSLILSAAHLTLSKHEDRDKCDFVHNETVKDKCAFVNATESCYIAEGFIEYTLFAYCTVKIIPLAMTLLSGWLIVLFIALGTAADDFFCPNIEIMAKTMRMSDNIAGVTLLAFGNGAPDVFSAISAVTNMKDGDLGLVFGGLLGAGVFLTTFVAGFVCVIKPFTVMQRPFLRDIIFYLVAVFFTFCIFWDGKITFLESTMYLIYYGIYALVVIFGRIIFQWRRPPPIPGPVNGSSDDMEEVSNDEENTTHGEHTDIRPEEDVDESTPLVAVRGSVNRRLALTGSFKSLFSALSPIEVDEKPWKNGSCIAKAYCIIRIPLMIIFKLTVPVVDLKRDSAKTWCKSLAILHCIVAPVFCVFGASYEFALHKINDVFYVWLIFLIAGFVLAVLVFFTSTEERPPPYHAAFAFVGFISAVLWIKGIANEIVNLLQTGGLVIDISNAVLGLTFLAWGNSIGDFISDVAMARRNKPKVGLSACFGGPLFNTLLGIGLPFTYLTSKQGSLQIQQSMIQFLLFGSVGASLVFSLIYALIRWFKLGKVYGIILIGVYVVFLVTAICVETLTAHKHN